MDLPAVQQVQPCYLKGSTGKDGMQGIPPRVGTFLGTFSSYALSKAFIYRPFRLFYQTCRGYSCIVRDVPLKAGKPSKNAGSGLFCCLFCLFGSGRVRRNPAFLGTFLGTF